MTSTPAPTPFIVPPPTRLTYSTSASSSSTTFTLSQTTQIIVITFPSSPHATSPVLERLAAQAAAKWNVASPPTVRILRAEETVLDTITGLKNAVIILDGATADDVTVTEAEQTYTSNLLTQHQLAYARLSVTDVRSSRHCVSIAEDRVVITASSPVGIAYGLTTVQQLVDSSNGDAEGGSRLPAVEILDRARFAWRGVLLDSARHFMPVDVIIKFLDLLAYHKMNVFHWHLVDDQGWRLELPQFPELTAVGAWRDQNGERYGGFYTAEDVRRIVEYAAERFITVVPEIELPGHCSASLSAYPHLSCVGQPLPVPTDWGIFEDVYCAGKDASIEFLKQVFDDALPMFPSPFVHIGGDEVPTTRWEQCEECRARVDKQGLDGWDGLQAWFISQLLTHLTDTHSRLPIGWDEVLTHTTRTHPLPPQATIQSWNGFHPALVAVQPDAHGNRPHALSAIVSPTTHCYFDYGEDVTDIRRVWSFEAYPEEIRPHLSYIYNADKAEARKHIRGGEACLWSERAPPDTVFAKLYPRTCALASRLWKILPEDDGAEGEVDPLPQFEDFHAQLVDVHLRKRLVGKWGLSGLTDGLGRLLGERRASWSWELV
ncbi:glycoside hydrolase superfamily [Fimicolochytrium jonesii]|uniref:glycoside hydrolase superfamily n=1 Tax=Fimicolochytrium jonesii TaxID=1396493 RepID=UPI0022FEDE65|nr:glycoside hydrolase superfamily [Fimicolochytrium jonesii]KAI8816989.1 glycoside hydrolase superfamily [Fimicolochytrium jonesii]